MNNAKSYHSEKAKKEGERMKKIKNEALLMALCSCAFALAGCVTMDDGAIDTSLIKIIDNNKTKANAFDL
jgi:hypothetical protein